MRDQPLRRKGGSHPFISTGLRQTWNDSTWCSFQLRSLLNSEQILQAGCQAQEGCSVCTRIRPCCDVNEDPPVGSLEGNLDLHNYDLIPHPATSKRSLPSAHSLVVRHKECSCALLFSFVCHTRIGHDSFIKWCDPA